MEWKCLICERELPTVYEGDDSTATFPNIVGLSIEASAGYGSQFDLNENEGSHVFQSAICDSCFESKQKLFRLVQLERKSSWKVVDWKVVDQENKP